MIWISEKAAAEMLLLKPRTLRLKAKASAIPITFTSVYGRRYQYSKNDIEKFLLTQSNKAGSANQGAVSITPLF